MNRFGDNLICTGSNEIVKSFVQFGVEFVVVGGLAVSWHRAGRQADDMDLLVNPTPEKATNVFCALSGLGLNDFEPDSFSKPAVQARLKKHHYADILTPTLEGQSFDVVASDAVKGKLFGFPVRIASVASLLQLKEAAATIARTDQEKSKHVRDIELLQNHAA